MKKSATGIYIESEYISLVRADRESGGITTVEVIPLDNSLSEDKAIHDGLKQLKSSGAIKRGEPIWFAFQSEQSIFFQTEYSPEVADVHETLSWELTCRTDEPIENFSFSAVPLGDNRALGLAYRTSDVARYTKMLAKVGIKPKALSVDFVSLVNLLEANHGANKETILFFASVPSSSVIYVRDGKLWDIRMIYGIEESTTPDELVPLFLHARNELRERWDIHDELLTKMTGSLVANPQIRSELARALPNCYELNCFETVPNETGSDAEKLSAYTAVVAVAAGLALSGVQE